MKKYRELKIGFLIIELFFTLLYFSMKFGGINLSINNEAIGNKSTTPILSAGKSVSVEWYHTWGGNNDDDGYGVAVDSSGNVYLAGTTYTFGAGLGDMVLVKYNGNGVQQWNRTWGGSGQDYGLGVAVDSSDNVYLTGKTHSYEAGSFDMVLVKYDGNGEQQWNCTWGGSGGDCGNGVVVDSSDNVYIAGDTASFGAGNYDMVLVKYDGNGVLQWYHTWGGSGSDWGDGVVVDSLDNVYLIGDTRNFGAGDYDIVLVKYDGSGVQQWYRTWGGSDIDIGSGVAIDSSDNVYLTGHTESFGAGRADMVLVKYDGNGIQQWNRTWGGSAWDEGFGVAMDSSGNVCLAGITTSYGVGVTDMVVVKFDRNGRLQWYRTWGGVSWDAGEAVAIDSSGNVYVAGATESFGKGGADMVLVKFSNAERLLSNDEMIMILIIVVLIASVVGIALVIIYFVRKRRKIVE